MKREDVKSHIPGITDEQLNWIMTENGNDINREKTAAEQFKTQLANANAQLKTAQEGLAAFDGKKRPEEYEANIAELNADMQSQAEGFAFDNALNTAILSKKGRSVKAVRALLDVDALNDSKADIDKALEEAAKANPWAFGDVEQQKSAGAYSTGAEHGTPPTGDTDFVKAALQAINPGNLVADRLDSADCSLALQMESDGSTELTTAGTAFGTTTALTEKTIYNNIVDTRTQLSAIGISTSGRWLLLSPDTYGLRLFLSTPSARRATRCNRKPHVPSAHFYPRPP